MGKYPLVVICQTPVRMPLGTTGLREADRVQQVDFSDHRIAPMTVTLDELKLSHVSGGRLQADGGNMFGPVPKVLWERYADADQCNRIPLQTNCLLVHSADQLVLIDTGYGSKHDPKFRGNMGLEAGNPLFKHLGQLGVKPEEINLVILTHLHFDHAGGCTLIDPDSRTARPAFPQARYVIQQSEWADATANLPELSGSYLEADFVPLERSGQLELIEGEATPIPGVTCRLSGGHTRGHQVVLLGKTEPAAIYLGDLCPTCAHLRTFWITAYEQFPLELRRLKPQLIGEAADRNWLTLFSHDPQTAAGYLHRDGRQQFMVHQVVEI